MPTYSLTPTDEANGQRLRYQGVRYADQKVSRVASATTTLAQITGGPGTTVYHSYVAGVGASNLSWLERNFAITVDGEPTPQIIGTGDRGLVRQWVVLQRPTRLQHELSQLRRHRRADSTGRRNTSSVS